MPTTADTIIELHRWYSVQVVARLLGVTDDCIRHRIKGGSLPAAKLSDNGKGAWRIKGEDVLELIGKMELARGGGGIVDRPQPRRSHADELNELYRQLRSK